MLKDSWSTEIARIIKHRRSIIKSSLCLQKVAVWGQISYIDTHLTFKYLSASRAIFRNRCSQTLSTEHFLEQKQWFKYCNYINNILSLKGAFGD